MKLCVVLLCLAMAGCQASVPEHIDITYGIVSDIKGLLQKIQDFQTNLQEKIAEAEARIEAIIQETKDAIDKIKDAKPIEHLIHKLQERIYEEIMSVVDYLTDLIAGFVQGIMDAIESVIGEIMGIKEKILEWLEDLLIKFAESLFGFARKIMDKMNTIEGYDWDGFIDYVMDAIKNRIHEKLEDIRQGIRDKIGRN